MLRPPDYFGAPAAPTLPSMLPACHLTAAGEMEEVSPLWQLERPLPGSRMMNGERMPFGRPAAQRAPQQKLP